MKNVNEIVRLRMKNKFIISLYFDNDKRSDATKDITRHVFAFLSCIYKYKYKY